MWPWLKIIAGWFIKFMGGFLPIGTKPLGEWFGKIAWVVGIILIFNFVTGFFHKPQTQNNAPRVITLPFSHVDNIDQSNQQKSVEQKRKWWMPIPYISVAGEAVQPSSGEVVTGVKAEAGLRLDF